MSTTTAPPASPVAPPTPPTFAPPSAPPPDPPRRRSVRRLLLGCLILLVCAMGVGATFVLEEVHTLSDALNLSSALSLPSNSLASAGWGDPQTLLLVGDDQRALTRYYHVAVPPHANEMILVRIDPSKPYISMMSIPRELQVTIDVPHQGPVTTRFNYAYTAGGIPLLVSTIKHALGLPVNHVMVITFARFKRAVDEMGCVYTTVDRRYFHVNVPGDVQYQEINLQPGYQNLCGAGALQFVSYRHADTSLVRDARDQSFLLDVKAQYGPTLAGNVHAFERIFGRAVQTDRELHTYTGLLNLAGTLISSAARSVRQVQFQVNLVPPGATPCSCVTANPRQIAASVHSFLYGVSPAATARTAAVAQAVHDRKVVARLPLVPTGSSQLSQARAAAGGMPFPYEYPRVQDRDGSFVQPLLRDYLIHAPGGVAYPIYVAVFSAGQLGQFYDVQGTTWTGAPLFKNPQQKVTVGGRTYYLFYESQRLNVVGWTEHHAAYWVRNSLSNSLPNGELLAIAEQTRPATGTVGSVRLPLALAAANVPAFTTPAPKTDVRELVGALGGLLGLLLVPLLAIPLIKRRGELRTLRAQVRASLSLEEELAASFARNPVGIARALAAIPAPVRAASGSTQTRPSPPPLMSPAELRERRVRSARRRRLRARVLTALVALAAVGGLLFVFVLGRGHSPTASGAAASVPSSPVLVLNATTSQNAARRLADELRGRRVKIAKVANLTGWQRRGLWILFAAGQRAQAGQLARLVPGRATIAPIDPATENVVGRGARVVVVIG